MEQKEPVKMQTNGPKKMISPLNLLWSGFKLNLLHLAWNFERLQNLGFYFSLHNMLRKIYAGRTEQRLAATRRHIGFFNTHIFFSTALLGVMVRLEEDLSDETPKAKEMEIESTKMGLMGPLAAIGDSLFWSGLKPFSLLLGVGIIWLTKFTFTGWLAGVVISLAFYNMLRIVIKYYLLFKSYYRYRELFSFIQKVKFQDIMKSLKVAGMGFLGAFTAVYLREKQLTIVGLRWLDSLVLCGAFILVIWALRSKKSVSFIFGASVAACIVLAYIT
jgi:mannose/fructose/N-acetylgalactosamine-specific phosphotransferase system component IID